MEQDLLSPLPGAHVRVRGDRWRVEDVEAFEDCRACRLSGVGAANRAVRRTLLLPFDRFTGDAPGRRLSGAGRAAWMRSFRAALLRATPALGLRGAAAARIDILAYQLEPALACVGGESRLLIADEVGLGKTIQAGLVLAELFARQGVARALVLAPASLCEQWVDELRHRFALEATHVDAAALAGLVRQTLPDDTPWRAVPLAVASFDFVKQPEIVGGVEAVRWDALVVDEAHMVALAVERSRAVRRIADTSRRLLLLTATPHAGDAEGFHALCGIGRLRGEPPILMFRRTRSALGLAGRRRLRLLRVRLSDAERALHEELERYTAHVWRDASRRRKPAGAQLAMVVLRKRAASGPAALEASLARRLGWLSHPDRLRSRERQLLLPLDDADEQAADEAPDGVLLAEGLPDRDAECAMLARLLALARDASATDSKAAVLERFLRRASEPAIVFTEYRDTLARLAGRLAGPGDVAVLHGGLTLEERRSVLSEFGAGRLRLLLATDAAAHGLNLQRTCRLVVNVELPWIPARLEQRIGRVDRMGQQRTVHAVHLVAADTAEERVLARLVLRIGHERQALGEADNPLGRAGEMEVARAAFEAQPRAGPEEPRTCDERVRHPTLGQAAMVERDRLERERRLARPVGRVVPRGGDERRLWTVVRRRAGLARLPPGVVCVFTARFVDDRDALVEEAVFVLHVAVAARLPRQEMRRLVPRLLDACSAQLHAMAGNLARSRLGELTVVGPQSAALAAREAAMAKASSRGDDPFQPGLFDRRASKRAEAERQRRATVREESSRRLDELSRASRLTLAHEPDLVLALGLWD